jgi:hypothetical protein
MPQCAKNGTQRLGFETGIEYEPLENPPLLPRKSAAETSAVFLHKKNRRAPVLSPADYMPSKRMAGS